MPKGVFKIILVLLVLCLAGAARLPAQGTSQPAAQVLAAPSGGPSDPLGLGRETPRGAVTGFVRAAQSENYTIAVQYFEPRRHSANEPDQELAEKLLAILNARFAGSLDSITNDPQGRQEQGPPREQVMVGGTRGLSESFPLNLVRTEVAREAKVWLISRQTLDQVPEVYDSLRFPRLEKELPRILVKTRILGMPLWQWIAIVVFAPVALALGWLVALSIHAFRQYIQRVRHRPALPRERHRLGPGTILASVIIHYYFVYLIGASLLYRQYYQDLILILIAFAFYWALTRITYLISLHLWNRLTSSGRFAQRSLVSLARRVLDVAIFLLIGLVIFRDVLGWNVTAALAGLGIGGLALGLGAQKTFENIMGGISILTDRALLVGDACRIGDQRGVVEDIGLRSTKLRTLDRTVVSIPNGTVATAILENYRLRDKILFRQDLRLRYDLAPDHLRYVLDRLREVVKHHPKVEEATARVRLLRLGENAIEAEIFGYILEREYRNFLAVQEELILQFMEVLEETGAAVALPTQRTMVTRETWIDPQKAVAAQKAMEKSRAPGVPGSQRPELAPDILPPKP